MKKQMYPCCLLYYDVFFPLKLGHYRNAKLWIIIISIMDYYYDYYE